MKKSLVITQNSDKSYSMSARGTDYMLFNDPDGRWSLWSSRKSLHHNINVRVFNNLKEIEQSIKTFVGLSDIISL